MKGYYGDPDATARAVSGGWLRTGDLGYLSGGELYVAGRLKDLIIVNGRNWHPQDLEWLASDVPGVRRGNAVAFGVENPGGGEEVVILVEDRGTVDAQALAQAVRARVQEATALSLREVVVVPKGTIPKTTSGKLQRARARARYERGTLLQSAVQSNSLLGYLVASQWAYATVAVRRFASRLVRSGSWRRAKGEDGRLA